MIAVQLTKPDLSQRQAPRRSTTAIAPESERCGILPADESTTITAQFQPLDPNIINETIPAFFIGRNMEGFWVARDAKGKIGGIFLLGCGGARLLFDHAPIYDPKVPASQMS